MACGDGSLGRPGRVVRHGEHGCDRVLFGTDGPWTDAVAQLEHLRSLPFTADELSGILGGNAERLLGLSGL